MKIAVKVEALVFFSSPLGLSVSDGRARYDTPHSKLNVALVTSSEPAVRSETVDCKW
jgi:hypothetical protein